MLIILNMPVLVRVLGERQEMAANCQVATPPVGIPPVNNVPKVQLSPKPVLLFLSSQRDSFTLALKQGLVVL